MKNIYEVFLKNRFDFVESAKIIKSILETASQEEKNELKNEMSKDLNREGKEKLIDNIEIFRKINFKLKHQKKKNIKYSFNNEDVKNFDFIYNELISLAISCLKNDQLKFSNVLYLIAIDEHTPNTIYEMLKNNKSIINVNEKIINNFYWLSAPKEKLDDFKSVWRDNYCHNLAKSLDDVLNKVEDTKLELRNFLSEKKVTKNDAEKHEVDIVERRLNQSKTLGVLFLHVLELYINKEKPNNLEAKKRVDMLLEKDIFSNYKESPFIVKNIKQIAEAYKKIAPTGDIPFLNRSKKRTLLNLDFIFAVNCKDSFEKNDFMNLLAQKNRNENNNSEFKSIINKKGMLNENSILNISKVDWHKNTNFEDIKRAFDFQGVPLSSKEWMIITLGANEKSCSDEAICYLNERTYKEDLKKSTEDEFKNKVVIRPRVKF